MGQQVYFILFVITLLVGVYFYYSPSPKAMVPMADIMDDGGFNSLDTLSDKKIQELNITTNGGHTQISKIVDDLVQEQVELKEMIDSEKLVLNSSIQGITDITNKAKADGKSDADILKLKVLGEELQDDQRLLMAHGQTLIELNNQLMKKRQLLAEKNYLLNADKDQSAAFFDKVKQENNEVFQHTQDLIDEERQKTQDQQP
jgi:hypothetical protein